jgi:hypothetical protein
MGRSKDHLATVDGEAGGGHRLGNIGAFTEPKSCPVSPAWRATASPGST